MTALVLGALATLTPASAQTRPSGAQPSVDLIERGRELFEDQRYEESIQTLSGAAVRPNSTKAQKIAAYRLLALDHIVLGDHDEAESFVRALLALEPDYELSKRESPRFRDFFAIVKTQWEVEGRPGVQTDQQETAVTLRHRSPNEAAAQSGMVLTAQVEDPGHRVTAVKLFFRSGSSGKFSEETAQFDSSAGSVRAIFPASAVRPPFVSYYLLAKDKNGVPLATSGDADAPLRIPVPDEQRNWLVPLAIGGGIVGVAGLVVGAVALAAKH